MSKMQRRILQWLLNRLINPDVFVQSNLKEILKMTHSQLKEVFYEDNSVTLNAYFQEAFDSVKETA